MKVICNKCGQAISKKENRILTLQLFSALLWLAGIIVCCYGYNIVNGWLFVAGMTGVTIGAWYNGQINEREKPTPSDEV